MNFCISLKFSLFTKLFIFKSSKMREFFSCLEFVTSEFHINLFVSDFFENHFTIVPIRRSCWPRDQPPRNRKPFRKPGQGKHLFYLYLYKEASCFKWAAFCVQVVDHVKGILSVIYTNSILDVQV